MKVMQAPAAVSPDGAVTFHATFDAAPAGDAVSSVTWYYNSDEAIYEHNRFVPAPLGVGCDTDA